MIMTNRSKSSYFFFKILLFAAIYAWQFLYAQTNFKEKVTDKNWWKAEAELMVKTQIAERGINDEKLFQIMKRTPRHEFVPDIWKEHAYIDNPLPIGEGQTISQPYIVALMTELLALKGNEKVLEIGTGSGYQAAILSQLADTVYSIEIVETLANESKIKLKQLGFNNVIVKCGDGYKGWKEHAPFDCIIVTAAPPEIPQELVKQLKINGKMVIPVGSFFQELLLIEKTHDGIKKESITPVRFVPMVHPKE